VIDGVVVPVVQKGMVRMTAHFSDTCFMLEPVLSGQRVIIVCALCVPPIGRNEAESNYIDTMLRSRIETPTHPIIFFLLNDYNDKHEDLEGDALEGRDKAIYAHIRVLYPQLQISFCGNESVLQFPATMHIRKQMLNVFGRDNWVEDAWVYNLAGSAMGDHFYHDMIDVVFLDSGEILANVNIVPRNDPPVLNEIESSKFVNIKLLSFLVVSSPEEKNPVIPLPGYMMRYKQYMSLKRKIESLCAPCKRSLVVKGGDDDDDDDDEDDDDDDNCAIKYCR
jgi:hypothetical protein